MRDSIPIASLPDAAVPEPSIDVPNRVANFQLPKIKILVPLFEAIQNSIHAIEDANLGAAGSVSVSVIRESPNQTLGLDAAPPLGDVIGFAVRDNGIGLNADNWSSFCKSDSPYKRSRGGRGIGRFSWLKAYQNIEVVSVFRNESGGCVRRSFKYTNDTQPVHDHQVERLQDGSPGTIIKLWDLHDAYRGMLPKATETIATRMLHYFFELFALGSCPQVYLSDEQPSQEMSINDIFADSTSEQPEDSNFEIHGVKFRLRHFVMSRDVFRGSSLTMTARRRSVETLKLQRHVPNLASAFTVGGMQCHYAGFLSAEYLDSHASDCWQRFDIPEERDDIFSRLLPEPTMAEIRARSIGAVEEAISEYLNPVQSTKVENYERAIREEMPEFLGLLQAHPEEIARLPPNLSHRQLRDELSRCRYNIGETRAKMRDQVLEELSREAALGEGFSKRVSALVEEIEAEQKSALAQYVAERKVILTLFRSVIGRKQTGEWNYEAHVHRLIYPMKKTSESVAYEDHNLWIVDERLAFHRFLASDVELREVPGLEDSSDLRPDIVVFQDAAAFAVDKPVDAVHIIEFKRPGRDDYSSSGRDRNPITQVFAMIDAIAKGKVDDVATSRPVETRANALIQGYAYVIADLTPTLRSLLRDYNARILPDGEGYLVYNEERQLVIEVMSYSKLIRDAERRHRAFFAHLGLAL